MLLLVRQHSAVARLEGLDGHPGIEVEDLHKVYPITKGAIVRRKVGDDGSTRALAEVGTLLWCDPELSSAWQDEQALADAREQYARERPEGWRGGRRP